MNGSSPLPVALGLARRPLVRAAAAALFACGAAAGAFPLLEVPGYEWGMLGCLLATVLGAPLGIAASGAARARGGSATSSFAAASAVLIALLAFLFGGSAVHAALASRCSAFSAAAFYPLLAGPSALLACALSVACAHAAGGRRLAAALLYAVLVLASLAATLVAVYRGPAAYALDPFLGAWPGPIYDEALLIDARLVLQRTSAVALAAALVSGTELALRVARGAPGRSGPALVLAVAIAAGVAADAASRGGGWAATRSDLAQILGGRRTGPRCDLVFPVEKAPADAERLARDCEFEAAEVTRALAVERPPRVTVYVYRSDEEKRRLVGAGRTNFTKPWLLEVHVTDAPSPHPVLRHELVHAIASRFARGPLRMPARAGILVSVGLVEGLAMALDVPHGEWTIHEWASAMRHLGLMPSVASVVGPTGFFGAPPARAYIVVGSFLRFLLDRHGPGPVRSVYGGSDFAAAFGAPLAALEADWLAFLDGIPIPASLAAAAEARFRQESIFARRCAREVASVEWRAGREAAHGRGPSAAALFRRAAAISGDPRDLRAAGDALEAAGDLGEADRVYHEALAAAPLEAEALREALESALGDIAWREGDRSAAVARYRTALALHPDHADERLLRAKLAALADPALEAAARPWLVRAGDPAVALARLARSSAPIAEYLAGRALLARGAPRFALAPLARAAAGPLPDVSFELEAGWLLAEAQCRAGRFDEANKRFESISRRAEAQAEVERAADDARRCVFEREAYGGAVAMPGDGPE